MLINLVPLQVNSIFIYIASLPLCVVISMTIHELFHFAFFKFAGVRIKELKISILSFRYKDEKVKVSYSKNDIFKGYCSCIINPKSPKTKICIAIFMGGFSNVLLFFTCLFMYMHLSNSSLLISHFLKIQMLVGLIDVCVNLAHPQSHDRKLIRYIREL